jgi:gas vesicle protein
MDPNYKPLQQLADQLHGKFIDMCDDRSDQSAQWLEGETKQVREDIEENKAPRAIEDRVRGLQNRLQQAKDRPTDAISPNHAADLFASYEQLRNKLRSMPNY